MLAPAKNNVLTTLATAATAVDASLTLTDASQFPAEGIAVLEGVTPFINEVVLYTGKSGNTLTGVTRGYDGTVAEAHDAGKAVAITIVAKHISDLQPKHGTTAERAALGATLDVKDTGRRFYDTDQEELYSWVNDHWERPVVSIGRRLNYYCDTQVVVLASDYRGGDLWADPDNNFKLRICRVDVITHTLADWVSVGSQN